MRPGIGGDSSLLDAKCQGMLGNFPKLDRMSPFCVLLLVSFLFFCMENGFSRKISHQDAIGAASKCVSLLKSARAGARYESVYQEPAAALVRRSPAAAISSAGPSTCSTEIVLRQ